MKLLRILTSGAALVAFCAVSPSLSMAADSPLGGTEWRVVKIDGNDSAPGVTSTLVFNADKSVNGNGGCNTFRGDVAIEGTTMKFGLLASTMMACEEAKSKQEWAFHQALKDVSSFAMDAGQLSLLGKDGKVLVVFRAP